MFSITAPFGKILKLPDPDLGDFRRTNNVIKIKRDMFSTVRKTHIQTQERNTREYTFLLTRTKGIELQEFVDAYAAEVLVIKDHLSVNHTVYLKTNPLEVEMARRALVGSNEEELSIQLTFEDLQ